MELKTEYKTVVVNPAYESAYRDWCACDQAYKAAVLAAMAGENNWHTINEASHARNQAKTRLDSIPEYITIITESEEVSEFL